MADFDVITDGPMTVIKANVAAVNLRNPDESLFRATLHEAIAKMEQGQRLVVDLTGVTSSFNSAAIGVLVGAFQRLQKKTGQKLEVVPSSNIGQQLRITKLTNIFVVHDSLDAARAAT